MSDLARHLETTNAGEYAFSSLATWIVTNVSGDVSDLLHGRAWPMRSVIAVSATGHAGQLHFSAAGDVSASRSFGCANAGIFVRCVNCSEHVIRGRKTVFARK